MRVNLRMDLRLTGHLLNNLCQKILPTLQGLSDPCAEGLRLPSSASTAEFTKSGIPLEVNSRGVDIVVYVQSQFVDRIVETDLDIPKSFVPCILPRIVRLRKLCQFFLCREMAVERSPFSNPAEASNDIPH